MNDSVENNGVVLGMIEKTVTILNKRGLHARASAKFVNTAGKFDAEVNVMKDGAKVCGTSIMGLMMLAAAPGDSITLQATGMGAVEVIAALAQLIADKFGEDTGPDA
jgi:phosphocarrier protein